MSLRPLVSPLVRRSALYAPGLVMLAAWPAPASAQEHFARNLGIYYELVPHDDSSAARLTRDPVAGSVLGKEGFQTGDIIVELDGDDIDRPKDVDSHFEQTGVDFIDVRTGERRSLSVWVPNWIAQDRLRRDAADDLASGRISYEDPMLKVEGGVLTWDFDSMLGPDDATTGPEDHPVAGQRKVEIFRIAQKDHLDIWEPYLGRVERVIADELAYTATAAKPDPGVIGEYAGRMETIYIEAVQEYARRSGLRAEHGHVGQARALAQVVLTNPSGHSIELASLTKYRIARAYNRGPRFIRYRSGQGAGLIGYYIYRIVLDDDTTGMPAWIKIEGNSPLELK